MNPLETDHSSIAWYFYDTVFNPLSLVCMWVCVCEDMRHPMYNLWHQTESEREFQPWPKCVSTLLILILILPLTRNFYFSFKHLPPSSLSLNTWLVKTQPNVVSLLSKPSKYYMKFIDIMLKIPRKKECVWNRTLFLWLLLLLLWTSSRYSLRHFWESQSFRSKNIFNFRYVCWWRLTRLFEIAKNIWWPLV